MMSYFQGTSSVYNALLKQRVYRVLFIEPNLAALKDMQLVENEPVFVKVSYVQFLMTAGKLILTHHVKNDQDILCLFFYNSVGWRCKIKRSYTEKFKFLKYSDFHYLSFD